MQTAQAEARKAQRDISQALLDSTWFLKEFLPAWLRGNRTALLRVVAMVRADPEAEKLILAHFDKNTGSGKPDV
jgi:hypothetical protein